MSAEGAGASINDHGGFSANTAVPPGQNEFVGPRDYWQQNLVFLAPTENKRAWEMRQDMQDFWRLNHQ